MSYRPVRWKSRAWSRAASPINRLPASSARPQPRCYAAWKMCSKSSSFTTGRCSPYSSSKTENHMTYRNMINAVELTVALVLAAAIVIMVTSIAAKAQGVTTNVYDARGNKIGSSTQIGNTTQFYDDRGRKVQSSTTTGNTTKYYDDRGRTIGTSTIPGRK